MTKILFFTTSLLLYTSLSVQAQFPEDALRFSMPGLGVGARSLGMGMAYTGIANDFSAVYWNPAGLGQMRLSEMAVGLSNASYGNTSTFFGNQKSMTNSGTNLNSLGLVYPFPTERGSLVIAVGYSKQADFTTGLSFKGFNPSSSIIPMLFNADTAYDMAYNLKLQRANGSTPYADSLTQSGKVLEGGGLNNVTVSAAFEAEKNLFIGGSLNFITGSYTYTRNYYEDDLLNKYNQYPFDFSSLSLLETIESDLSGFSAKLGMLYKFGPGSRFGFTVKTPSLITVREIYSRSGESDFDDASYVTYATDDGTRNEYDVVAPFVFSAGFSHSIGDLMVAGDVEYTDWTQMEFRHANARLLNFNTDIKQIFQPTANLRVGAEYEFSGSGFRLRGGYAYLPSPYRDDPASFAQKYITGGFGFIVQDAISFDVGFAHGTWNTRHINYSHYDVNNNPTSETLEKIKTTHFITTVSYRF